MRGISQEIMQLVGSKLVNCQWGANFRVAQMHKKLVFTFQGSNISPLKVAGKMIFLFHRWDMLLFDCQKGRSTAAF